MTDVLNKNKHGSNLGLTYISNSPWSDEWLKSAFFKRPIFEMHCRCYLRILSKNKNVYLQEKTLDHASKSDKFYNGISKTKRLLSISQKCRYVDSKGKKLLWILKHFLDFFREYIIDDFAKFELGIIQFIHRQVIFNQFSKNTKSFFRFCVHLSWPPHRKWRF